MEKKCFKCDTVKPLEDFYKHTQMADGRVNKCKQCNKKDVSENRGKNIEKYRLYDRNRGNRQGYGYVKEYREKYPNKFRAHSMVNNAIRKGALFSEPCGNCGGKENLHAHHDDYLKPLNVRWLCSACHSQWHRYNGEAMNP